MYYMMCLMPAKLFSIISASDPKMVIFSTLQAMCDGRARF